MAIKERSGLKKKRIVWYQFSVDGEEENYCLWRVYTSTSVKGEVTSFTVGQALGHLRQTISWCLI